MRFCHYLSHNTSVEMPSNLLFVDTEAKIKNQDDCQIQTFRLGCAIHCFWKNGEWISTTHPFYTIKDFWDLLDKYSYPKHKLYVFAHNMAYDYTILKLDSYISSRELEITMRVIDPVFLIKCQLDMPSFKQNRSIMFLSSTNYYKQSLKQLGEMFGITKLETPDFENISDSKLMTYCIRDVKILTYIIQQHIEFLKKYNLGNFKPTIAGQSFTAFKHRFMNTKLLVHNHVEILEMEQKSYRGGRCEAFRLGKHKNIYKLDINSMYPFVMKIGLFPTIPLSNNPVIGNSVNDIREIISSGNFVLAECDIELKKPVIACKRDKLIFPIGKIRETITSPEIEYLLNHPDCGTILKVNKSVTYSRSNIFSDYVNFFYNIRMKSDNEAIKCMCKIMLNSLYGKLGQRCFTTPELITDEIQIKMYSEIMREENTFEVHDDISSKYVKLGEKIYHITKSNDEFAKDSIPIIASSVTAYSRILLFELMEIARHKNVLYCDTDSLFVTENGYSNLQAMSMINPTELGKMKLEEIGNVEIFGAKDYKFNDKVKLKGIKANAELLPDGSYRQFQFQTKNIRYRNGTPDGIVILNPIIKKISRKYDKGIVNGKIITPHLFSDF